MKGQKILGLSYMRAIISCRGISKTTQQRNKNWSDIQMQRGQRTHSNDDIHQFIGWGNQYQGPKHQSTPKYPSKPSHNRHNSDPVKHRSRKNHQHGTEPCPVQTRRCHNNKLNTSTPKDFQRWKEEKNRHLQHIKTWPDSNCPRSPHRCHRT